MNRVFLTCFEPQNSTRLCSGFLYLLGYIYSVLLQAVYNSALAFTFFLAHSLKVSHSRDFRIFLVLFWACVWSSRFSGLFKSLSKLLLSKAFSSKVLASLLFTSTVTYLLLLKIAMKTFAYVCFQQMDQPQPLTQANTHCRFSTEHVRSQVKWKRQVFWAKLVKAKTTLQ